MSPNRKRHGYDYPTDWAEAERLSALGKAQGLFYDPPPAWHLAFGVAALIFAVACITGVF